MDGASLVSGIWEHLWYGLQHAKVLVPYDKPDTSEPAFLEPYKERASTFLVFFHAFRRSDDLPVSVAADTNGNKDGDILDFSSPASL